MSLSSGTSRFVRMPSGAWYDSWTGNYLSDADLDEGRFQRYPGSVSVHAISAGRKEDMDARTGNYKETRTSTVEVKAESTARKIRKTEVPADVEQLPEDVKIISEERIGDARRTRAVDWLTELKVLGYFLESEEGEYDRRVTYVNEARTAKQLAAVMDDLPSMPAQKKYHGTMTPGADDVDLGKWIKDHRELIVGSFSFPASVLVAVFSALAFFSSPHTAGKWVAGGIIILVCALWFFGTVVYCAPDEAK